METPYYLPICEASDQIASGALSPVALTEALFQRIAETDGQVNSYNRLMRESAMAEARASEERAKAGDRLGPLDGIGMGIKDLYDTAGVVTSGGTGAYRERVPTEDATAVRKLREAGAVLLGKTNTHELAMGGSTANKHYGATHNPWKHTRVPGGSSGGSGSALAAGQALGALGSDTGGSIRIPAAFCGISGHKPTYGLVGRGGVIPLSLTLDHAGPMARTAEDCALMLTSIAGPDDRDLYSARREGEDYAATLDRGVDGLKLAVIPSLVENCNDDVQANFHASLDVLRGLGATIDRCEPLAGWDSWRGGLFSIFNAEAASYARAILSQQPETISEPLRGRLLAGLQEVKASDYVDAYDRRRKVELACERAIRDFDAFLLPTSPVTAEPVGDPDTDDVDDNVAKLNVFNNTVVFDVSHQPAISVPNGFDGAGLPTGLMIAAAQFNDAMALRIGHAYQQATDFHTRRPQL